MNSSAGPAADWARKVTIPNYTIYTNIKNHLMLLLKRKQVRVTCTDGFRLLILPV